MIFTHSLWNDNVCGDIGKVNSFDAGYTVFDNDRLTQNIVDKIN